MPKKNFGERLLCYQVKDKFKGWSVPQWHLHKIQKNTMKFFCTLLEIYQKVEAWQKGIQHPQRR
jgi:hypothetical protein